MTLLVVVFFGPNDFLVIIRLWYRDPFLFFFVMRLHRASLGAEVDHCSLFDLEEMAVATVGCRCVTDLSAAAPIFVCLSMFEPCVMV